MCIPHVSTTNIIHLSFYMCDPPKTSYMYYRCSTTCHVSPTHVVNSTSNIDHVLVPKRLTCGECVVSQTTVYIQITYQSLLHFILIFDVVLGTGVHISTSIYGEEWWPVRGPDSKGMCVIWYNVVELMVLDLTGGTSRPHVRMFGNLF